MTLDDEFERIAQEVPGFAGWYFDPAGTVVIVATSALSRSALPAAVVGSLGRRGVTPVDQAKAKIQSARFDFAQLRKWYRALQPAITSDPNVVSVDIDEVTNALVIGSLDVPATRGAVDEAVETLGIAKGAVHVVAEVPTRNATEITENVGGPPPGGVGMNAPHLGNLQCTAAANVTYNGVSGFLTASHCTINWGGVANATQFRQGTPADPVIGIEHTDPFYQTCSSVPPRVCRWTDAAFVAYTNGATGDFAKIVRTAFFGSFPPDGNTGSKTISTTTPRFSVISTIGSPVVGTYVDRVGVVTGWVTGPVNQTCVDRDQGSGKKLWCQSRANGPSQQGDSGGPIFIRVFCPGETVERNCAQFAGIYWGLTAGQMYFSPAGSLLIDFPGTFVFF